ncbi:MAG: acetate--CoA ligase family protein [Planctomycetota bacterium]
MSARSDSLDKIFRPRSVAVVGASRKHDSLGRVVLKNLLAGDFTGTIFPVNPNATSIHGLKCYPRVADIPDPVDLAIVVVPADSVPGVAEDCASASVGGLVVISAGFAEIGGAGTDREKALVKQARSAGMRLVGPNCMGVLNTEPGVRMNGSFAPVWPERGPIALISQSGAMGVAILNQAASLQVGLSKFISIGNKPDVNANDVLEYLRDDPETSVILLYLESFGDPRAFVRIAREITPHKPIVLVKAGRTAAGAAAASSHTGALVGSDSAVDALLGQCGVLRVESIEALFDVGSSLAFQPLPKGRRVVVVTNAGGPGILATDALERSGLEVPALADEVKDRLREFSPAEASLKNPIDLTGGARPEQFQQALEVLLAREDVDAALTIFVEPVIREPGAVAEAIGAVEARRIKPVLSCFVAREVVLDSLRNHEDGLRPVFVYPESAVRGLAALAHYREIRETPRGEVRRFDVDREKAAEILGRLSADGGGFLSEPEAYAVLEAYGIPVARYGMVRSADDAVKVAEEIGGSVVMKLIARSVAHKSDIGGVMVDVQGEQEIRDGFHILVRNAKTHGGEGLELEGILVQEMVRGGREMILGMKQDPVFGPVLLFGLGGIYVEVLEDVALRLAPITDREAHEMVRSIRAFPLLEGVRGEPPASIEAIEEVLQRLSQLVDDFECLEAIDINPFLALEQARRGLAVDARIVVAASKSC